MQTDFPLPSVPFLSPENERQAHLLARILTTTHSFAFFASEAGMQLAAPEQAQLLLPLDTQNDEKSYGAVFQHSIHIQDRVSRQQTWNQAIVRQQPRLSNTFRVRDRHNLWHWLHEEVDVLYEQSGWNAVGTLSDVTDQERNAVFHVGQTRALKMIAEHQPLNEILDTLNLLIEGLIPGCLTCILGYTATSHTIFDLSAPHLPQGYRQAIDGLVVAPNRGSCGAAISHRRPIFVQDIANDPLWTEFVPLAVDCYGLRACWSHPLLTKDGNPVGTFAIYHLYPRTPTSWERELLAKAAYLAGVAIERANAENQIRYQATHDALTRLPNRHQFKHDIAKKLEEAQTTQTALSLLFLDLDRFKQINDSLGHSFGDHLLTTLAERMKAVLGDGVYRTGGDEFTILLPKTNAQEAERHINKLRAELTLPVTLGNSEYHPTFTVGICDYPSHAPDSHALVKYADIALHRAKEKHSGSVRCFDPMLARNLAHKVQREQELQRAVEQQEFTLHYQLKVDAKTQQPTGVEALIRWLHPERGMILPGEFIPIAEKTGLILSLGDWVLQTACAQARTWELAGVPLCVSVNISARQLIQPNFHRRMQLALQSTGARPDLISCELTETAILQQGKSMERTLTALKSLGVRLELDDFGTGYSSLVALRNYQIDVLKIDRLFVHNLKPTSTDATIVRGVIEMGHALNMTVVAEGVENRAEAELLTELGCDELQGFYFARPVSVHQLDSTRRHALAHVA